MFALLKSLFAVFLTLFLALAAHSGVDEARNAMSDKLWDVAYLHLQEAVDDKGLSDETRANLLLLLAEALIRGNRPDEAIKFLQNPSLTDHPEASFWMAQAFAGKGLFDDAVEEFLPLTKDRDHPFQAEAAFTSASLLLSFGKTRGSA